MKRRLGSRGRKIDLKWIIIEADRKTHEAYYILLYMSESDHTKKKVMKKITSSHGNDYCLAQLCWETPRSTLALISTQPVSWTGLQAGCKPKTSKAGLGQSILSTQVLSPLPLTLKAGFVTRNKTALTEGPEQRKIKNSTKRCEVLFIEKYMKTALGFVFLLDTGTDKDLLCSIWLNLSWLPYYLKVGTILNTSYFKSLLISKLFA